MVNHAQDLMSVKIFFFLPNKLIPNGYQSELYICENNPPQLQQPTSFIFLQDRKTIHLHFYKEIQFSDNILA